MTRLLVMWCVLGLAIGCGDDSESDSPAGDGDGDSNAGAMATVGSDGGEVESGGAGVDIPAGALSKDVDVKLAEVADPPAAPSGYSLAGPAIAFTPHGTSFDKPVTLTLPFKSDSETLVVLRLDDDKDKTWEMIEGAEFGSKSASLEVESFSIYAVGEAGGEDSMPDSGDGAGDGDGDGAGDGDAAGDGDGDGDSANTDGCAEVCAVEVGLGCANGWADQAECVASCEESASMFGVGVCQVDFEAFGACVAENLEGNYECDADGEPGLKEGVCMELFDALITCATTGVNSKGEMAESDGSVIGSCVEMDENTHTCSDYIGGTFLTLPIEEAICSGDGYAYSDEPCATTDAIGKCHVDEGGSGEQITYTFAVSEGVDAAAQQICEQALMGVYEAL